MSKSINQIFSVLFIALILLASCKSEDIEYADIVFKGGTIYTVNEDSPIAEAVAVIQDKIVFVGSNAAVLKYQGEDTKVINLENKVLIPGFIDSHGHFMGMGYSKLILDLTQTESYTDVINMVEDAVKKAKPGEWIEGRGWHQDKWTDDKSGFSAGFPVNKPLNAVSADNPVILTHASGHSVLVNVKALESAGISKKSLPNLVQNLKGGEIMMDETGNLTGILNENAIDFVSAVMPDNTNEARTKKIIDSAIEECQKNGITSFHDAGVGQQTIDLYMKYKQEGKLGVRINAMLTNDSVLLENWFAKGPMTDSIDYILTIRSVKLLADGALGNRGALLTEDYSDQPGWKGLETTTTDYILKIADQCLDHGFQLCIHAIGDQANRNVLNAYETAFTHFPEKSLNHRFRIEHAQHLHSDDIPRFAKLKVIAAMQAIHMSSDRPWAIDRLGKERITEGAYVWQKLIQSGAIVMNGTDVPVEPVNPIACFYSAVSRKTLKGNPEGGYEADQKMTKKQALRSYTLNGAYGSFEEDIKGSVEVGKLADFAILDKDIMRIPEDEILSAKVVMTVLGGKIVYNSTHQNE